MPDNILVKSELSEAELKELDELVAELAQILKELEQENIEKQNTD